MKYLSKPGRAGTLYRWQWTAENTETGELEPVRWWGYDEEHALESFEASMDFQGFEGVYYRKTWPRKVKVDNG